jgi:hypothetical protein
MRCFLATVEVSEVQGFPIRAFAVSVAKTILAAIPSKASVASVITKCLPS